MRVIAAGLLAAMSPFAAAGAASVAVKVDAVSWWSRQPGAAAQPAGGFQIAYGVDGAESVAAIRLTVPQAAGLKATLVLTESSSSVAASSAAARVCSTAAAFPAANPGAYAQAPKADCGHAATLKRSGGQWSADVSALLTPGASSGLFVEPLAGQVPTYTVTITKATVTGSGTAPADTVPATTLPAAVGPAPLATPTAPASPSTTVASATGPTSGSAPVTTTTTPAPGGGSGIIASPTFTPDIRHHGRPWGRLIIFVPLAAAAGAGAAGLRRRRDPSALGR